MKPFFSLPLDLIEATHDESDPVRRYAAVMTVFGFNPNDPSCQELMTPGGRYSLPVPQGSDWGVVLEHKHRWEDAIRLDRMHAAANFSQENN